MKTATVRDIDPWDDEPTIPGRHISNTQNDAHIQEEFRQAQTCPEIPSLRLGNKSIIFG